MGMIEGLGFHGFVRGTAGNAGKGTVGNKGSLWRWLAPLQLRRYPTAGHQQLVCVLACTFSSRSQAMTIARRTCRPTSVPPRRGRPCRRYPAALRVSSPAVAEFPQALLHMHQPAVASSRIISANWGPLTQEYFQTGATWRLHEGMAAAPAVVPPQLLPCADYQLNAVAGAPTEAQQGLSAPDGARLSVQRRQARGGARARAAVQAEG